MEVEDALRTLPSNVLVFSFVCLSLCLSVCVGGGACMFLFHLARAFVMPHSHKAPSRVDNFSAPPLTTFPLGLGSTAACTWQPTSLARCNFVLKLQLHQKSVNGRQQNLLIGNLLIPRSYFKSAKSCFFYNKSNHTYKVEVKFPLNLNN